MGRSEPRAGAPGTVIPAGLAGRPGGPKGTYEVDVDDEPGASCRAGRSAGLDRGVATPQKFLYSPRSVSIESEDIFSELGGQVRAAELVF